MALKNLGSVQTGTIVKLNVSNKSTNFIVVQQGRPASSYYDTSFDNVTWLLMQDVYSQRKWGDTSDYKNSDIHTWLNNESSGFLSLLDADIRAVIPTVKIPIRNNTSLNCKIFLLSCYELGWTQSNHSNIPVEGAKLDYFIAGTSSAANQKRIANNSWWTRSMNMGVSGRVWHVDSSGDYNSFYYYDSDGVRPAFVIPSTLLVNDDNFVVTNQPPTAPGSINVSGVVSGGTATITITAATDPDGTIANYVYERSVDGGEFTKFATANSLTQTDQIDESWGTVAYRACAIDNAGATGPYVTSETYTINSSWLLIGGPTSNLGVKGNKFDFKVTIGVSGESSITDIAVTIKLDGKLIYDDTVNQDETITQAIDTRTFGSGQHDIQVVASKEDYLSAAAAYVFTVPSMALPDGGYSAIAQDSEGNPVFYVTTGRNVIGANGMSLQSEVDQINKSHRGTTGHLEFLDSILGPESTYELDREENVTYAAQLFAPANSTSSMSLACIYAGYTGTIGSFLTVEANKLKPTVPANSILSLYKYVLDTLPDAETDPTVNFVAIEQPKVLSAATNTGVTATDLNDALKQMMSEFPTQNYYAVTNTTGEITYYIVSQAKITGDTTTVNCAYVASNAPNKWYRNVTVNFINTQNVTGLFTSLDKPVVVDATSVNSVSVGSTLNDTLIAMIKAQPTYHRYRLHKGDTAYYVLSNQIINANSVIAENVLYCTASGTYYNNETLTLNVEASFTQITSRKIYQVSSGDPATHVGDNLQETLNAMLNAYSGRHAYAIERDGEGIWYILTTTEVNAASKQVTDAVYCAGPGVYYTQGTLKFGFDISTTDFTAVSLSAYPKYINQYSYENQHDANALKPLMYIWTDENFTDEVIAEVGYIDPEGIKNYPYKYRAYFGQNMYYFTKISTASEFKRIMLSSGGVSDMLMLVNATAMGGPFYTLSENGPFRISCYE